MKNTMIRLCVSSLAIVTATLMLSGCSDLLPTAGEVTVSPPTNLRFEPLPGDSARIGFKGNNSEPTFAGYYLFDIMNSGEPIDSMLFNTAFVGDTAFYVQWDPATTADWGIASFTTGDSLSEIQIVSSDNQTSFRDINLRVVEGGAERDAGLDVDQPTPEIVNVQGIDPYSGYYDGSGADLVFTATDSGVIARGMNGAVLVYLGDGGDSTFSSAQCDSITTFAENRKTAGTLGKLTIAPSGEPIIVDNDTVHVQVGDVYAILSGTWSGDEAFSCAYATIKTVESGEIVLNLRK